MPGRDPPSTPQIHLGMEKDGGGGPRAEASADFPAKRRLPYSLYHNNTDINEEFLIVQNSHRKKASFQNNSFA